MMVCLDGGQSAMYQECRVAENLTILERHVEKGKLVMGAGMHVVSLLSPLVFVTGVRVITR